MIRRLTLRRADGEIYLNRWGIGWRTFGIYLHRMDAPDPGLDLHDHPWWFASIVIKGGYTEERADIRNAPGFSGLADLFDTARRGVEQHRRRFSVRTMRLDECHRIIGLDRSPTWTIVIRGPIRRRWGFYEPTGWVHHRNGLTKRRPLEAVGPNIGAST